MKTKIAATALIIASTLIVATPSFAGVTREEVKAELAQAIRTGDMPAPGNRGLMLNELYPNRYPAKQVQASLTREQVKAELAQAVRTGDIQAPGNRGLMLNELYPSRYPAKQAQASLTREQVKAELAEAIRTGDFMASDSGQKCNEIHPDMHPAV
jgi:methyl coenzyme M reductase gamma subunit